MELRGRRSVKYVHLPAVDRTDRHVFQHTSNCINLFEQQSPGTAYTTTYMHAYQQGMMSDMPVLVESALDQACSGNNSTTADCIGLSLCNAVLCVCSQATGCTFEAVAEGLRSVRVCDAVWGFAMADGHTRTCRVSTRPTSA